MKESEYKALCRMGNVTITKNAPKAIQKFAKK